MKLVLVLCLCGLASAANPNYAYHVKIEDPQEANFQEKAETRKGEYAQGFYSVLEPNGAVRTVSYVADEWGFNPQISYSYPGATFSSTVGLKSPALVTDQRVALVDKITGYPPLPALNVGAPVRVDTPLKIAQPIPVIAAPVKVAAAIPTAQYAPAYVPPPAVFAPHPAKVVAHAPVVAHVPAPVVAHVPAPVVHAPQPVVHYAPQPVVQYAPRPVVQYAPVPAPVKVVAAPPPVKFVAPPAAIYAPPPRVVVPQPQVIAAPPPVVFHQPAAAVVAPAPLPVPAKVVAPIVVEDSYAVPPRNTVTDPNAQTYPEAIKVVKEPSRDYGPPDYVPPPVVAVAPVKLSQPVPVQTFVQKVVAQPQFIAPAPVAVAPAPILAKPVVAVAPAPAPIVSAYAGAIGYSTYTGSADAYGLSYGTPTLQVVSNRKFNKGVIAVAPAPVPVVQKVVAAPVVHHQPIAVAPAPVPAVHTYVPPPAPVIQYSPPPAVAAAPFPAPVAVAAPPVRYGPPAIAAVAPAPVKIVAPAPAIAVVGKKQNPLTFAYGYSQGAATVSHSYSGSGW